MECCDLDHQVLRHRVFQLFERISAVPRCSGREQAVAGEVMKIAREHGFSPSRSTAGNVVIAIPGARPAASTRDAARKTPLVLQAHLDMVCEKDPGNEHDFSRDPIRVVRDGEWLRAVGTTLGADDGIGVALALAVAIDVQSDVGGAGLELLFTVNEEAGMSGARAVGSGTIRGRRMINLDSEFDGQIVTGCAGNRGVVVALPVKSEDVSYPGCARLRVGGLRGGHSGVDIHRRRANAIVLLCDVVRRINARSDRAGDVRVITMSGGEAGNAIPRNAEAVISVPHADDTEIRRAVSLATADLRSEYPDEDSLEIDIVPDSHDARRVVTAEDGKRIVSLVRALPCGPIEFRRNGVETSASIGRVELTDRVCRVSLSLRGHESAGMERVTETIRTAAREFGATATVSGEYSPWPASRSALADACERAWIATTGERPLVAPVHAGLECGIIAAAIPGLETVAIGPTIEYAHSPFERLSIASTLRVYRFLLELCRDIA